MSGARPFWWEAIKRSARTASRRLRDRFGARFSRAPLATEPSPAAAPGPDSALAPDGGAWVSAHLPPRANGARPRAGLAHSIYLPPAARSRALPLVVMLHGCEQTAAEFAQGTRMNELAGEEDFVVLYPQQSTSAHRHLCWQWYDRATQGGSGDAASIAAMIESVVAKYGIDRSRIYAAGMSAGASMAHILALRRPELIAAVGLHSGVAFGAAGSATTALAAMRFGATSSPAAALRDALPNPAAFPSMPAILIHGGRDSVVSPINLAHLSEQFRTLNGATERIAEPVSRALATLRARRRRRNPPPATRLLRRQSADAASVRGAGPRARVERGRQRVSVPRERGTGRERAHVGVLQVAPPAARRARPGGRCHPAGVERSTSLVGDWRDDGH